MKTSTLIILQVLPGMILDEVYGVIVDVISKLYSNSCCENIHLYDDVWEIRLIQFEALYQFTPYY